MTSSTGAKPTRIPQVTLAAPIIVLESPEALTRTVKGLGLMGVPPVATFHVGGIKRYFYAKGGVVLFVLNDDGDELVLGTPKFGISLNTDEHGAAAAWLAEWLSDGDSGATTIPGSAVGMAEDDATFVKPDPHDIQGVVVIRVDDNKMSGPTPIPFVPPEDWLTWNGEN
jgi:hypothetical protein